MPNQVRQASNVRYSSTAFTRIPSPNRAKAVAMGSVSRSLELPRPGLGGRTLMGLSGKGQSTIGTKSNFQMLGGPKLSPIKTPGGSRDASPRSPTTGPAMGTPPKKQVFHPEIIKAIFLDIDGVICCNRFCRLEENKLCQLERVCKATGAKIVLSSDWRRLAEGRVRVKEALTAHGMELIGFTPQYNALEVRPMEICKWLDSNNKLAKEGKPKRKLIKSWIAIDDRDLVYEKMGERLRGHFVKTNIQRGLTSELADSCIRLLMKDDGECTPLGSRGGSRFA